RLRQLLNGVSGATAQLNLVLHLVATWRVTYAQPTIDRVIASGQPVTGTTVVDQGKAEFDPIRDAVAKLQVNLVTQRQHAAGLLHNSARVLNATLIVIAVALLLTVVVLALGLWRSAVHPLNRLPPGAPHAAPAA